MYRIRRPVQTRTVASSQRNRQATRTGSHPSITTSTKASISTHRTAKHLSTSTHRPSPIAPRARGAIDIVSKRALRSPRHLIAYPKPLPRLSYARRARDIIHDTDPSFLPPRLSLSHHPSRSRHHLSSIPSSRWVDGSTRTSVSRAPSREPLVRETPYEAASTHLDASRTQRASAAAQAPLERTCLAVSSV